MEDEDALGVSIESGTAVAASGALSGSAGDTGLVPLLTLDDLFLRMARMWCAARMAALWWRMQLPWTS